MEITQETPKKSIHFIGMGGIGMSGIARMYLSLGHAVQGSDVRSNEILAELERMGARVLIGHAPSNIEGANLVVYSSSIKENHPERLAAKEKGVEIVHRADALAELCRGKFTIAIAGTHGKTTTTALVGVILKEAMRDPSVVVGGVVGIFGGNACPGRGPEIVIEADESDASFLKFSPDIEVITNIEKEHLDHYGTVEKMEEAFHSFVQRLSPGGIWIGCAEDAQVLKMAQELSQKAIFYGFDPAKAEYHATDVVECPEGERGSRFTAWHGKDRLGVVQLKIMGLHNVLNSLAAIAVADRLGVAFEYTQKALVSYEGAGRRFDVKYENADYLIVDDYAHHPTEIQKTLLGARGLNRKRVIAIFQPHRYTRTQALLQEFGSSFFSADKLVITDIYSAGEAPIEGVTGRAVAESAQKAGHPDAVYVERAGLVEWAKKEIRKGDLVLLMGAGDISQAASDLGHYFKNIVGENFFQGLRGKVLRGETLSRHTSLKIGGPADFWIEPEDAEDLSKALSLAKKAGLSVNILGAGSNTLADDRGVAGAVIHLSAPYFKEIALKENNRLWARTGLVNTMLIQYGVDHGLGGFEFLSGIPGNLGGSIAMNAGSHQSSVEDFLESIKVMTFDGETKQLTRKEIPFRYRSSGLKNLVILEAVFNFPLKNKEEVMAKLEEYRGYRSKTQDLWRASAGCMFKNPVEAGCSAGKLIDDAGLKGFAVGKARVSEKHANFIVNTGGATAEEVCALIEKVRQTVKEKFKIDLETEVKVLGKK